MAYRTYLELVCGDRHLLDRTVDELQSIADRKGANTVGPHAKPTRELRVPLYKRIDRPERFSDWRYRVFTREMEIVGHESVARAIAQYPIDRRIKVALSVEEDEVVGARRRG